MAKTRITNLTAQAPLRRKLRTSSTKEEVALWKLIKGKQICGLQFRRQFSVGPYVLDFYCPKVHLCIELDGIQHHSEEEIKHDTQRTNFLKAHGIEVLRIDNNILWDCSDMVVATITDMVQKRLQNQTKNGTARLFYGEQFPSYNSGGNR